MTNYPYCRIILNAVLQTNDSSEIMCIVIKLCPYKKAINRLK